MADESADIRVALEGRGLSVRVRGPNRLIVSRHPGPVTPDQGNSFWLCQLAGHWYVCTWAPRYYRVPAGGAVPNIAGAFAAMGWEAQGEVSADLVASFVLVETGHDEFDEMWDAEHSA
jgi:hypothetical protein